MTDNQSTLLPPSDGNFTPLTPSGLTPNTRSEAEAALTHNSAAQTDSAAPDPKLVPYFGTSRGSGHSAGDEGFTEAQKAYRRPGIPRTSSTNYEMALKKARQESVSSNMSAETDAHNNMTGGETVASPTTSTVSFPPPGQGVVPLNYGVGVGSGQGEALKKTRSRGLSLGALARQQSWNQEDFKRVYNADLLTEPKEDAGYGSKNGFNPTGS